MDPIEERRRHPRYRVGSSYPCTFAIESINNIPANFGKPAQGEILDISMSGLRLCTGLLLPVELGIIIIISFRLKDVIIPFRQRARLVSRYDGLPPTYGVEFLKSEDIAEDIRFQRAIRALVVGAGL